MKLLPFQHRFNTIHIELNDFRPRHALDVPTDSDDFEYEFELSYTNDAQFSTRGRCLRAMARENRKRLMENNRPYFWTLAIEFLPAGQWWANIDAKPTIGANIVSCADGYMSLHYLAFRFVKPTRAELQKYGRSRAMIGS